MNKIKLVENRYSQVVPLMTFQISMTEGQIKFLLRCIEHYEHQHSCIIQDGSTSGLYMGGVESVRSILSKQLNHLSETNSLLVEYSKWGS